MRTTTYSFILSALLLFPSCASDSKNGSKGNAPVQKETNTSSPIDSAEVDLESEVLDQEKKANQEIEFDQSVSSFQYKVLMNYQEKFKARELRSVDNGMAKKMNPDYHRVSIEKTCYTNTDLDFFTTKYPEFLTRPMNEYSEKEGAFTLHPHAAFDGFYEINAIDFFKRKDEFDSRDLLLIFSEPFYYDGAKYVHVWEISNDRLIHQRRATYKFDATGEIIEESHTNHAQMGYDSIEGFLSKINETK